jgi:hypothetical protein
MRNQNLALDALNAADMVVSARRLRRENKKEKCGRKTAREQVWEFDHDWFLKMKARVAHCTVALYFSGSLPEPSAWLAESEPGFGKANGVRLSLLR